MFDLIIDVDIVWCIFFYIGAPSRVMVAFHWLPCSAFCLGRFIWMIFFLTFFFSSSYWSNFFYWTALGFLVCFFTEFYRVLLWNCFTLWCDEEFRFIFTFHFWKKNAFQSQLLSLGFFIRWKQNKEQKKRMNESEGNWSDRSDWPLTSRPITFFRSNCGTSWRVVELINIQWFDVGKDQSGESLMQIDNRVDDSIEDRKRSSFC